MDRPQEYSPIREILLDYGDHRIEWLNEGELPQFGLLFKRSEHGLVQLELVVKRDDPFYAREIEAYEAYMEAKKERAKELRLQMQKLEEENQYELYMNLKKKYE